MGSFQVLATGAGEVVPCDPEVAVVTGDGAEGGVRGAVELPPVATGTEVAAGADGCAGVGVCGAVELLPVATGTGVATGADGCAGAGVCGGVELLPVAVATVTTFSEITTCFTPGT